MATVTITSWETTVAFFIESDCFEVTEAKAQNIIDLELEKIGMELFDSSLPTHVYNRETGQVTLRWCLLEDKRLRRSSQLLVQSNRAGVTRI